MSRFAVSDGAIPEAVLTWLEAEFDLGTIRTIRQSHGRRVLCATLQPRHGDSAFRSWEFDWSHDREPTLAEAILAVATKGE